MTDISSVKAHAEFQPSPVAPYSAAPYTNGSPALDGPIEEESSTIKCICGFQDDDGSTVLCEKCDTWQHIVCYYESNSHVPDVHECTDCFPRPIDAKGATDKQRLRRELNAGERKGKPKPGPKSHKKRVKDPLGQVLPNGWAVQANNDLHYGSERKSGSPRDQPPPSKRPKTSHRASGSVSMLSQTPSLAPGSRKRASSAMFNGQSPVKSPTNPAINGWATDEYSPEFMQLYRQEEPQSIESNSFTDIGIPNDMSQWLTDPDALAEATKGMQPAQVFQRIDKSIQEIESTHLIEKQTAEDSNTTHDVPPQWHFLTAQALLPSGSCIGELKGLIGRRADYFSETSNRWDLLQHPEPFVFFPPHLPIYIDARREGNVLRYARRSCDPNMEMKILTHTEDKSWHFCFVTTREIQPGEELTIGWELPSTIKELIHTKMNNGDFRPGKDGFKKIDQLPLWVSLVFSNFGGCACDEAGSKNPNCVLDYVRRSCSDSTQPKTKSKRAKKSQVSPLSTGHATNSRANSEAFKDGLDDENMDSRSTSGSRSKPGSRDITPMTHFSVDGGDKMTERDRRKLQQQERLFEQLEYDEQHRRRKRNSAGSTMNTPGLSSSKQLGHLEPSPSATKANGTRKTSGGSTKANGCPKSQKPRPVYVDSCTQTDDNTSRTSTPMSPSLGRKREMKPPMSFKRRLLQQAAEDRIQRERSMSVKTEAKSPALEDVSSKKPSPAPQPDPPKDTSDAMDTTSETADAPKQEAEQPAPAEDVEMKDAEEAPPVSPGTASPKVEEMPDAPSHPPIQPPPPPWPSAPSTSSPTQTTAAPPSKPTDLHLQLPAPDLNAPPNLVVTPGSVIAQSPLSALPSNPSPFSPAVTNAVNPTPARKKLSLSDYTSRKAKLAQTQPAAVSASPPLTHAQTAPAASQTNSSPTLSTSSLPGQASPSNKSAETTVTAGTLPAVVEENPTP